MPTGDAPPSPLHARVEGTGPPVLLVHGLGSDHTIWNPIVPALAKNFRVLAVDLRGHGRSVAAPGSTYDFAELEADLFQFLDGHAVDAAHLVGFSAGAFLALQTAVDAAARCRSLTVIGGAVHCDAHTRGIAARWLEARQEGSEALVMRILKDAFYPEWVEDHLETVDLLRERVRNEQYLEVARTWGERMTRFDLRGRVGRLRLPTLVVQGMEDRVIDSSHARLLRQSILGAQLKLLPATGHMVPIERPKELAEMLEEWFHQVESSRSVASDSPTP